MAKTTAAKKPAKAKPKATKAGAKSTAAKAAPARVVVVRQPGVERRRNHPVRAKDGYMQVLLTQTVTHVGGSSNNIITLPNYIPKALYNLEITTPNKGKTIINLLNQ